MKKPITLWTIVLSFIFFAGVSTSNAQQGDTNTQQTGTAVTNPASTPPSKNISQTQSRVTEEQLIQDKLFDLQRNHPDLYYQYMKEINPAALKPVSTGAIGNTTPHIISAQEYMNMPAAKKAHIDQNPQMYIIQ